MGTSNTKKRVVLGVTGSIAAYKAAELARLLLTRGYHVRVVMTNSAQEFITPVTFEAITGEIVATDFWEAEGREGIEHISLADWADVLVIAPATADCIAKLVIGSADSPLLAVALATKAPILVAPAMNVNMLSHPATQENLAKLESRGVGIVEAETGELACGWNGAGRLASPWELFCQIERALAPQDFAGRHVVITTGPTREALDPIRFISNRSSGKMGIALAIEAFRRGARVTLLHGPVAIKVPRDIECVRVDSAAELQAAVNEIAFDAEQQPAVVIMASAVADFRPSTVQEKKIKKSQGIESIAVTSNPDILSGLGDRRGTQRAPVLVGFAIETGEVEDLLEEVRSKIDRKNVDLIVGNLAEDALDKDTNRVWLVDKTGRTDEISMTYKSRVAVKIFDAIKRLF